MPGYTQVFVDNVNGQQCILSAMYIRELQLDAQSARENLPPAVHDLRVSVNTIGHRVNALDKIAIRPDLCHEVQIRVLKRSIKCLLGFLGGRES